MPRCLLLCLTLSLSLGRCEDSLYAYYSVEDRRANRELTELFDLLDRNQEKPELQFVLIQQISDVFVTSSYREKQILFLTSWVDSHQHDPYNAFYLLMVAESYEALQAATFAVHYYERVLKNHPDLIVQATSIHFYCLKRLLELDSSSERRIEYYKELISRFYDSIDPGSTYYFLALLYEQIGEWDQAIQAFKKFLQFPESQIPGFPGAYKLVKLKVDFYNADKSWTVPELQTLLAEVKRAIWTKNPQRLLQFRAKVGFFVKSWERGGGALDNRDYESPDFDISSFLLRSRVLIDSELSSDSSEKEAFLRTTGWHTTQWVYRIPTWYLYFRRVDYRADPEIDGRWEWAGIYFGEKL